MDSGARLRESTADIFPSSFASSGEQSDLPMGAVDALCHNKPQYIVFIYVLQACHNSLASSVPPPLCTLNTHVVTLNSREFTLRKYSMF